MSYRSKNELNITGPMDANSRIIYAMADLENVINEKEKCEDPVAYLWMLAEVYDNAIELAREIDERFLDGEPWTQKEIDEFCEYLDKKYNP